MMCKFNIQVLCFYFIIQQQIKSNAIEINYRSNDLEDWILNSTVHTGEVSQNISLPCGLSSHAISLLNITHENTKLYVCPNVTNHKFHYLFVNDTSHLLASQSFKKIEEYWIQCKPSLPETEVLLVSFDGEIYSSSFDNSYNPKLGFPIKKSLHKYADGYYVCLPRTPALNNQYESLFFKVDPYNFISSDYSRVVITSYSLGNVQENETFQLICHIVAINCSNFDVEWKIPGNQKPKHIEMIRDTNSTKSILTIFAARKTDEGDYDCIVPEICQAEDGVYTATYNVKVLKPNEHYIELTNHTISMSAAVKEISVKYRGFPLPIIEWFCPEGEHLATSEFLTILHTLKSSKIIFNKNVLYTGGNTVSAYNKYSRQNLTVFINMQEQAMKLDFSADTENQIITAICDISAKDCPKVDWRFQECYFKENENRIEVKCNETTTERDTDCTTNEKKHVMSLTTCIFNRTAKLENPGFLTCYAQNKYFRKSNTKYIFLNPEKNFLMKINPPETKILQESNINITCASFHEGDIIWYHNDVMMKRSNKTIFYHQNTPNYRYTTLHLPKMQAKNAGNYKCKIFQKGTIEAYTRYIDIEVLEFSAPILDAGLKNNTVYTAHTGQELDIPCTVQALPNAEILWIKEGFNSNNCEYEQDKHILRIRSVTTACAGGFQCIAFNREGQLIYRVKLDVTNQLFAITISSVVCFLALALVIFFSVRWYRMRRELRKMLEGNIQHWELDNIDDDKFLNEQAEKLPYEHRFEFPANKLTLGKELGSGAFGLVLEAEAENIKSGEYRTKVAVKMLKPNASKDELQTLVSELKIFVHLGQHLNIVNLLGAVTKNIENRELMVIVEYCAFGSVDKVLRQNRCLFVDQIDKETDQIDMTVEKVCKHSNYYTPLSGMILSTTDLVSWSYQIAQGMQYLSSKRVLHGDLAARNILLCENNLIKICDFGLSSDLYKKTYYRKKENTLLPIKWLALESLEDNVFTSYTDIWSYGVVLWELFSLGQTPYAGMHIGTELYKKIKKGYRLEKPDFATNNIYDIMFNCWRVEPLDRPNFGKLMQQFLDIWSNQIQNKYVNMVTLHKNNKNVYSTTRMFKETKV